MDEKTKKKNLFMYQKQRLSQMYDSLEPLKNELIEVFQVQL